MILQPVIMCGGSGTRLWPLSRQQYPKQLLRLTSKLTMLQDTIRRLDGGDLQETEIASPILVGNEEYRFLMAEQLREIDIPHAHMILEPCGRNTAPALTLAALTALDSDVDPVLVVMPADHVIQDIASFKRAIKLAASYAVKGNFVTFGIKPSRPETGYGYIEAGASLETGGFRVNRFIEKPDLSSAEQYVAHDNFHWNSGIFVMKASAWISKISELRSDIHSACQLAHEQRSRDTDFIRPGKEAFFACPADSIDYAVMEHLSAGKSDELVVIPVDIGWSDVGAWDALWEIGHHDHDGNTLTGDAVTVDTRNSLVISESRLVACIGLQDAIVVETSDAVMVASKHAIQKVKDLVAQLDKEKRRESQSHRKVHRPWGWYDAIDAGKRFQVKRIVLHPGASISLQMHHHRAEHWIVVSGTAQVTRGDEVYLVSENESTFIPLGTVHRLENPGIIPLEIIEVQSGSYLGEDDITRLEDRYGR